MFRHTLFLLALLAGSAAASSVSVRETQIVLPTYLAGEPELNPMFFFGRQSQGAQAPVYPYPLYDTLTGRKVEKTYKIVYLENEYIRIGVLPEIGGRIFEGVDKTNNYDFIYRQHVIKPALIGLIGAWISGGVEWNVPHHHRATTFIPVQYGVEENADGSKTVWVGELELRHRMRWAAGYTLRPGKAYLEASLRVVNRTPVSNTMLCFANLAVHTNENYQVIFHPGTQYGTHHAKRQFTSWPVSKGPYGGGDFSKGVDISWYKNHISSNSVFAWNYEDDFVAGYDHGRQAGTMSVADHGVVPGKKFWTWGNGPAGRAWDKILTDEDGPYIELMVGAYSDNQPDYSWLAPFETRAFSMNWYPFRDIGGVKKANLDAAVNLEVKDGGAKLGFYTTSPHNSAKVVLKAGGKTLLEQTVAIDPGKPFLKQVALPAGTAEHDLTAALFDGSKELVSYRPVRLTPLPAPKPVTPPAPPGEIRTIEELYLIGLRAEQFHDPAIDPIPYWEEALRRDPGDSRVNTAFGIRSYKRARYQEAERYLRRAVERLTDRYTTPKDAEAIYYLGAALRAQGRDDEAFVHFYKATWSQAQKAAGYYGLAEIAGARGDLAAALEFVERSIDSNALSIRAHNLRASILRHLGRKQEALQALAAAHRADPLDVRSMAEAWLLSKSPEASKRLAGALGEHPATAQETAAEYRNAGMPQDGMDVLSLAVSSASDKSRIHPMVYYYLGDFAARLGQASKAAEYYRLAQSLSPDYVFPFQNEAIEVLRAATRANPRDAKAFYYLGNLLYDWQPEEATRAWEASAALDPSFAIVHRNLATAYVHQAPEADVNKAIAALEKAASAARKYPLHFTELDDLYEQAGAPVEKRLELLAGNSSVVGRRDDALNRLLGLQVAAGQYDEAIRTMTSRHFAVAEGANLNVAENWTDAHLLRGRKKLQAGQYREALADFKAAFEVPSNLPLAIGRSAARNAEAAYWTGAAHEGLGERDKAVESWKRGSASQESPGRRGPGGGFGLVSPSAAATQSFYQASCLVKLGEQDKARSIFQRLVDSGSKSLEEPASADTSPSPFGRAPSPRVRKAAAHYSAGLGYIGLNETAKARAELSQAVSIGPELLGARTALASLR